MHDKADLIRELLDETMTSLVASATRAPVSA
jgi:hypothetical protein